VPIAIRVSLEEYSSRCIFRGVGGDGEGCGEIWEMEDWFRQEKGFKRVEGSLTSGSPVPLKILFGEVDEGTGDIGVVRDESTVEVGKAEEGAYVLDFSGCWPFGNSIEFDGIHGELTWFDNHSKVFHLVSGEFALLKFEVQIQLGHSLEDTFGAFLVGSSVGGEDKEVVHVDDKPSFRDHISEGVVHESLEGGRGVGETKEHDSGFEEAFMGDEGGLPLVSVFDADVVVAPSNIELGEDFGVSEFIDEVGDWGKWVGISNGMFVEVSIVLAWSESSVLFLDKEKGGGLGRVGGTDFSSAKVFVKKFFGGKVFVRG